MAKSGASPSIYARGVRDSSGNIIDADCMSPRQFDAIVDSAGCGDYTLPSAAFAAGAKSVFVRTGTYVETTNVIIPEDGCLIGEELGGVIINFSGAFSILIDGNGGVTETAGTVSITHGTSTVTGTGTTFTNLSPGDVILLGGLFYFIDTITNNTSLTIEATYQGTTISGQDMLGQTIIGGICIDQVIVNGSSTNGIFLRGVRNSSIKRTAVTNCTGNNIHIEDCAYMSLESVLSESSDTHGLFIDDSFNIAIDASTFRNNALSGVYFSNNANNLVLDGCVLANNAGRGILADLGANNINVTDCITCYNNDDGIDLQNDTLTINIVSCISCNNGAKGIDFDGTECTVTGCVVNNNGDSGIGCGPDGTVVSNHCASNASDGIRLSGDDNCVIQGNVSINNGGEGILLETSDDCVVTGNVCQNNTGNGIEIQATCDGTLVTSNHCSGNATPQILNNGTNTILGHNIDGQANGLPYLQRRFQTIKTTNTQNLNVGTPVIITWNANQFISSEFSHTVTSGNVTINNTGTYRISFQVNYTGDGSRKNVRCAVYVNGTINNATISQAYSRNSTDDQATCSLPGYEISLTAADVVTIRGNQEGSSGTANTNLNQCWLRIERIS